LACGRRVSRVLNSDTKADSSQAPTIFSTLTSTSNARGGNSNVLVKASGTAQVERRHGPLMIATGQSVLLVVSGACGFQKPKKNFCQRCLGYNCRRTATKHHVLYLRPVHLFSPPIFLHIRLSPSTPTSYSWSFSQGELHRQTRRLQSRLDQWGLCGIGPAAQRCRRKLQLAG
jgi:hypothetical protein